MDDFTEANAAIIAELDAIDAHQREIDPDYDNGPEA